MKNILFLFGFYLVFFGKEPPNTLDCNEFDLFSTVKTSVYKNSNKIKKKYRPTFFNLIKNTSIGRYQVQFTDIGKNISLCDMDSFLLLEYERLGGDLITGIFFFEQENKIIEYRFFPCGYDIEIDSLGTRTIKNLLVNEYSYNEAPELIELLNKNIINRNGIKECSKYSYPMVITKVNKKEDETWNVSSKMFCASIY